MEKESEKIKVELDESNYFTGNWARVGGEDSWTEVQALPEETKDLAKLKSYKYENGGWAFDEGRYALLKAEAEAVRAAVEKKAEIKGLKDSLNATDYKVIKCYECSLAGTELPYDIAALHEERQAVRDRINELEDLLQKAEDM